MPTGATLMIYNSYSGQIFKIGNNLFLLKVRNRLTYPYTYRSWICSFISKCLRGYLLLFEFIEWHCDNFLNVPVVLYNDNQQSHKMAANNMNSYRTKHIDIKYHFIRDAGINGKVVIKYLPTWDMIADSSTKLVSAVRL